MSTLLAIHWNVSPEFFSLGPVAVRWYGLMFALGFLLGYQIMFKMFKFESSNTEWLDKLFIYTIVATIVGARLGHVFFYGWSYYSQHLIEIVLPIAKGETGYKFVGYQGLASHGGALGIVLAIYFYSKKVEGKTFQSYFRNNLAETEDDFHCFTMLLSVASNSAFCLLVY